MNKHTPAPWTVNPKAKTNIRHGNLTIANCSSTHDGSREEEEIANAKLIAASPELLEALIMCFNSLQTYDSHPIIEKYVNAAIKKATDMTNKTYLAKYNAYKSKKVVKDDNSLLFWVVLLTLILGLCTN